ncbi:hypothetical protein EAE91_12695 [Photorhabdus noenieputensis]|uniref:hypothetical protein n=1 Tax=Photorhabdus noenieputensis TaxID=1208607 RepID=UPI001BD3A480|nr:hypothetical protein [Photorhabdus noenieputensis]MBS9437984.1 hypothetical protein [Photorhabdus noenieputensis]MCK3671299.1 hypothetical protein [Photorhabdus noenieputensis]
MTHKKYNPTWDGYMGDFLRGNVGINQLKPQHEFKEEMKRKPRTPEADLQYFFNTMGRIR